VVEQKDDVRGKEKKTQRRNKMKKKCRGDKRSSRDTADWVKFFNQLRPESIPYPILEAMVM
jgi:hypothetical protein